MMPCGNLNTPIKPNMKAMLLCTLYCTLHDTAGRKSVQSSKWISKQAVGMLKSG